MQQTYGLERIGLMNPKVVYRNMSPAWLTEQALLNGEGVLSDTGALVVRTGKYTGRAPDDKFIVDTPPSTTTSPGTTSTGPFPKKNSTPSRAKSWPTSRTGPFTSSTALPAPTSCAARNSASSMNWPANVSSSATSSFGRQRKNWPSMANRTSLSSSPRASSAIRRATAPIPRRPSSSTTNRVPSSSPVRAMPGKSRRASFRS